MMEVTWHDPPPRPTKYSEWFNEFVAILQTRPAQWAEIPPFKDGLYSPSLQTTLRKNHPECEWRLIKTDTKNKYRIFGRYLIPTNNERQTPARKERVDAIQHSRRERALS